MDQRVTAVVVNGSVVNFFVSGRGLPPLDPAPTVFVAIARRGGGGKVLSVAAAPDSPRREPVRGIAADWGAPASMDSTDPRRRRGLSESRMRR